MPLHGAILMPVDALAFIDISFRNRIPFLLAGAVHFLPYQYLIIFVLRIRFFVESRKRSLEMQYKNKSEMLQNVEQAGSSGNASDVYSGVLGSNLDRDTDCLD
jgi:hypothetical protein